MRDEVIRPYSVVLITLDSHAAVPAARAEARLAPVIPGLRISVHAAAEWAETPAALEAAKADIRSADIIVVNLLFLDEHVQAILPSLIARRDECDAMVCTISSSQIVKLTRMGGLDMARPQGPAMKLLRKLRGSSEPSAESGKRKMMMLRRLPRILKHIPGRAQDLRAWFLCMQYWLGSSDDNVDAMIRLLVSRYTAIDEWHAIKAPAPIEYPEVGVYHPDMKPTISTESADLPIRSDAQVTVGLLLMRSYILSGDTAHYDAVIAALEKQGANVVPVFASGLDARPAIERYFLRDGVPTIDAFVSLTGFSLVGGPAYNDSAAAEAVLAQLDIPYISAHPLEFQTLAQWSNSDRGLSPVETTMLVALPEIDGATTPTVFAGRHGPEGCTGCSRGCRPNGSHKQMAPCPERVETLAARAVKRAALHRSRPESRRVAIVLYGFPPNAGAVGTAAYLSVFESLFNTLRAMKEDGYDLEPPETVDALKSAILEGNAERFGQQANVLERITADQIVTRDPYLAETEAQWGPAPGRHQSDGSGVFVLGARFGKVLVGVQPAFGFEGDPMRLLFEKGFAPTHAFNAFYRYLREDFSADVLLHFGMHGALEFMPGKQSGPAASCWPDRLIGDMPNIYLYAANNPSEASLAKRRSNAVTISHLTPPLARAGLYKGLLELKASLERWRTMDPGDPNRAELAALLEQQATAVDLDGEQPDALWHVLLETEHALITEGLHVLGAAEPKERTAQLDLIEDADARKRAEQLLAQEHEIPALLHALSGRYIRPVPGGDLIRNPEILPTGRNIHAFDPFRMPTAFAMHSGARQVERLLEAHRSIPKTVALVLWGSDNIKTDGAPIAQALSLLGATPRFDEFGRLSGADLVPLETLKRPRIDVVMTLSGIFRDLLPLQTKMLAEAAWKAAIAEEPDEMNFVRANTRTYAENNGIDFESAARRVFSNADGTYGSNVNQLVDSGAWTDEDELADAYQTRKCWAYGRDGRSEPQGELLQAILGKVDLAYQNLESVELGVTSVDHYFDTLGGIARAVKRAKGAEAPVYIGDQTCGNDKVRTLAEQVALETRSRTLNPKWFEGLLKHGHEGVHMIESQVTNTFGWSATTAQVQPWVYQRLTETFVLDETMRRRMAELNPTASARMANRLLEAHDRAYWQPDAETLEALQRGADELEDRLEGIGVAAQ